MLEYLRIVLRKVTLQIHLKTFFLIKKVKSTLLWTYVINDLKGEEIVGLSYKKKLQKTNHKKFRIEKLSKGKDDKLYVLNGKYTISQLITE